MDALIIALAWAQFGWAGLLAARDFVQAVAQAGQAKSDDDIKLAAKLAAAALVSLALVVLLTKMIAKVRRGSTQENPRPQRPLDPKPTARPKSNDGLPSFSKGGQEKVISGGHGIAGPSRLISPKATSALQQASQLFSARSPGTIQIGDSTFAEVPNTGSAAIFSGATEAQVQQFFLDLTGSTDLPAAQLIPGKGTIYVVSTPSGNFTLRDFSSSSALTGPTWTIDLPKTALGTTFNPEIKFLQGNSR